MTRYILQSEALDLYDDMLDEVHETVKFGDLHYDPSRVLKEIDPIAYQCGFNDWLDSKKLEIGTWEQVEAQDAEDTEDDV